MENSKIIVLDRGLYTTCTVNLQGATVTSWRINNHEQLFVSRESHSQDSMHITGGIHLVFPHFGEWCFGPRHGFARSSAWSLEEGPKKLETDDIVAVFSLTDDPYTHALWGYRFKLTYKITLCKHKLIFHIGVENLSTILPFEFHILQHMLLRVPDVSNCEVIGLRSCPYVDLTVPNTEMKIENNEVVRFLGHTDKIFKNAPRNITISNVMNGATLKLRQREPKDINLWNPGPKEGGKVHDLGNGEYKNFISIKSGTLSNSIHLEPSGVWKAGHSFQIIEPGADKKLLEDVIDFFSGFC